MGDVLGELLPLAVGVAISPVPVIAVILMLLAPRARAASAAFGVGWVVGIALVTAAAAFLSSGAGSGDEPSTVASWVKLGAGVLLVLLAVRQWQSRPREGEPAKLPKWMSALDQLTAPKAAGLGALLSGVNPKNLLLCLSAGATIGAAELSDGDVIVALVVFVALASASVAVPVIAATVAGAQQRDGHGRTAAGDRGRAARQGPRRAPMTPRASASPAGSSDRPGSRLW
jgi:threonine/homoserine/homoserine lactone efflux protein